MGSARDTTEEREGGGGTCVYHALMFILCLDQLFSRIAEYLRKHDAYDRKGILAAIEYGFSGEQYEKKPVVQNLDRAANISDWITPYLAPTPNVTQFRQFKLEMVEGKVCVSGRSRCAEEAEFNPWQNLNQTGAPTSSPVTHTHLAHLNSSMTVNDT